MWQILTIPFLGTSLGAACVFFFKNAISEKMQRAFTGFASGVMVAASFFSLLLPALEQSEDMGRLGFLPASIGFAIGMMFLLVLDMVIPHMHLDSSEEGMSSGLKRTTKLVLAVTLHNIPEGMAVGIVCAGWMYGDAKVVEPIGALLVIIAAGIFIPVMPYFLSFAAGAMIYVVVEELIPEMSEGEHSNIGTICFALGFVLMMALDVGLG